MLILTKLFYLIFGGLAVAASALFALFVVLAFAMFIHALLDKILNLKEKALLSVLFLVCVLWGGFLTNVSFHYGTEWLLQLR
jgi:hypothetical protein